MHTSYYTDEQAKKIADYIFENAEKLVYSEHTSLRREYPDQEHLAGYNWLIVEISLGTVEFYFTSVSSAIVIRQKTTTNIIPQEQITSAQFSKAYKEVLRLRRKKGLEEGEKDKDIFFGKS
jgi:predicted RNA-binding protein associated with RNAse of E/G family